MGRTPPPHWAQRLLTALAASKLTLPPSNYFKDEIGNYESHKN